MTDDFVRIDQRAAAVRLTFRELVDAAGLSQVTVWRAREGKVGLPAQVRTIRSLEKKLDAIEAEAS